MRAILIWILLVTSCAMCADAQIALKMSYYNSDDNISMSLDGANLAFESFCTLEPHSLTYNDGSSSKQPEAEYSYSLALDGETMFSSAETDSGMFGWSGNVEAGGDLGLNSLKVSTRSAVKDGSLKVAYGNDEFKVQEMVETKNSKYQQQAQLGPGKVVSLGSGSTLNPVPGLAENLAARNAGQDVTRTVQTDDYDLNGEVKTDGEPQENSIEDSPSSENQDQGIKYSLNVQTAGAEKQGSIDANVMSLTEAQWSTQVKFEPEDYSIGVRARGIGFAPIDELDMIGQATGFPQQVLPPGKVEISYKDRNISDTPELWEKYPGLIEIESQDFHSAYAGMSTPALWYYLNNMYHTEGPLGLYIPIDPLEPLEKYQLSMAFKVKGK
ncbi:MAG: hypothetical protein ACXWMO_04230 [Syntrophales bacterium]